MAEPAEFVDALIELAMAMKCAANDFHCMHFNIHGMDFDTMHADVLKTYYEQADGDFDELCEKAQMLSVPCSIPNASQCADIAGYKIWEGNPCTREVAIERCNQVMETINVAMTKVFLYCNKIDSAVCIGVANYLAGRIEYWTKEQLFFNRFRS